MIDSTTYTIRIGLFGCIKYRSSNKIDKKSVDRPLFLYYLAGVNLFSPVYFFHSEREKSVDFLRTLCNSHTQYVISTHNVQILNIFFNGILHSFSDIKIRCCKIMPNVRYAQTW